MVYKYEIIIERPSWKGYKYAIFWQKNYGDHKGGCTEVKTKHELLKLIKKIIRDWESYDYILNRFPDKVTEKNLLFKSFTKEITLAEIFGNTKLDDFLKQKKDN